MIEHDIRYSEPDDLLFLKEWFFDPKACQDYPFDPPEMEDALKNWIGFAKYKASLTAVAEAVPCAVGTLFLMPYKKVAHHAAFYLMVAPDKRRQGIGTSMVRNLLHLAKTRFRLESVHAEIFEPSALEPILKKLQFEPYARQDNYAKIDGTGHPRALYEHFF